MAAEQEEAERVPESGTEGSVLNQSVMDSPYKHEHRRFLAELLASGCSHKRAVKGLVVHERIDEATGKVWASVSFEAETQEFYDKLNVAAADCPCPRCVRFRTTRTHKWVEQIGVNAGVDKSENEAKSEDKERSPQGYR